MYHKTGTTEWYSHGGGAMDTTLVKVPGFWRSYESRDGRYTVQHSQNAGVWTVNGGPHECYPLSVEQVYVRTLKDARAEIARRESARA